MDGIEARDDPQPQDMYAYGIGLYQANAPIAFRSAQRIVPKIAAVLPVRSVLDFGCGRGAWLKVWAETGAEVMGVDGPFVDRQCLLIDPICFNSVDLALPIDLGRQFDLVQSLEVAEHLPAASAEQFVTTLTDHGTRILFAAAVPGQGGEHHINEQPLQYWRDLFRKKSYTAIDLLRPQISNDAVIEPWYRYNMLLYVRDDCLATLPEPLRSCQVPDGYELRDYRPWSHRLQNAVIKWLPTRTVDLISRMKWRLAARVALTTSKIRP